MKLTRWFLAGVAGWALLTAPAWAAEPAAAPEDTHQLTIGNEAPPRPELDVLTGVKAWRVNGDEISISAVQNRAMLFHGMFVLQDMVQEKLLLQEAKRRNVTVAESEVDAKVKGLREDMGLTAEAAFDRYLRAQRVTITGFREMARDYVYMEKVLGDRLQVSDAEVQAVYKQFQDQYRRPETASFRAMTLPSEAAAQAAKLELTKGRSFEEVAKATAFVPVEKGSPGALRMYQRGVTQGLPAELETAIFNAPLNQVTGPVKTREGFILIKVEKKVDPRQFTLEEMRDGIRTRIAKAKLETEIWPRWINGQLMSADIVPVKAD